MTVVPVSLASPGVESSHFPKLELHVCTDSRSREGLQLEQEQAGIRRLGEQLHRRLR